MADRAGYSVPKDKLPKGTDDDFAKGMVVVTPAAGYLLVACFGTAGIMMATTMGSTPWKLMSPWGVAMALLSLWLTAVSAGSLAGQERMTPLGTLCSMVATIVSVAELSRIVMPTIGTLVSADGYAQVFLLILVASFPVVAAPLSVRRMQETLWQDVNWSILDSAFYRLGVSKASWVLAHIGNFLHDRYAVVDSFASKQAVAAGVSRVRHFVLDKMLGRMALVEDDGFACRMLSESGYDIERIRDKHDVVRRHEYSFPAKSSGDLHWQVPPARGITEDEYYHRL